MAIHRADRYDLIYRGFRWHVPARFNIGEVCCARWARATPEALAVRWEHEDGRTANFTYRELDHEAARVAGALERLGVRRGDRVAIVMPQRFETAVAHMAVHRIAAVAMPLSMLFGPDALQFRLADSEACVAIVDESAIDNLLAARAACPSLRSVIAVGDAQGRGDIDWTDARSAPNGRPAIVARRCRWRSRRPNVGTSTVRHTACAPS